MATTAPTESHAGVPSPAGMPGATAAIPTIAIPPPPAPPGLDRQISNTSQKTKKQEEADSHEGETKKIDLKLFSMTLTCNMKQNIVPATDIIDNEIKIIYHELQEVNADKFELEDADSKPSEAIIGHEMF